MDEGETDSTASFIGIVVAISGNVLISLALNCQKLAHLRLERERSSKRHASVNTVNTARTELLGERRLADTSDRDDSGDDDDDERTRVGESSQSHSPNSDTESDYGFDTPTRRQHRQRSFRDRAHSLLLETEPLLVVSHNPASPRGSVRGGYGTRGVSSKIGKGSWRTRAGSSPGLLSQMFSSNAKGKARVDVADLEASAIPVDIRINGDNSGSSTPYGARSKPRIKFAEPKHVGEVHSGGNESDYLKSKLWWFGFLLMNVGEMGNFISYAFAPASVVAPLGTFALVANCFFSPLMLSEQFRKRDLLGVGLAIMGAITVVLSASPSDTRLDPDGLIRAISQHAFIVLAAVYAAGAMLLVSLSSQRVGQEHVFIDVGACALFGGFTVLSTKAFSSLLTKEWAAVFKEWITYPILAILIGTGVGQIRYLNRALMKFDSKTVIPTQFVLFNLSAIIGSAVLYGDFRKATLHQMVTFLYGCGATFAGVFMLTWGTTVEPEERRAQSPRTKTSSLSLAGRVLLVEY